MQKIPQSSFTKKEPVDIDIPILLKGERKSMQPTRMATNPASSDDIHSVNHFILWQSYFE